MRKTVPGIGPDLDFQILGALETTLPPEGRYPAREEVRPMLWHMADDSMVPARCSNIPGHLSPGDVVVVDISSTMGAALPTTRTDGELLELHPSARLPGDLRVVELRRPADRIAHQTAYAAGTGGDAICTQPMPRRHANAIPSIRPTVCA